MINLVSMNNLKYNHEQEDPNQMDSQMETDLQSELLSTLEESRILAKENPVEYLPELASQLFVFSYSVDYIDRQQAIAELYECLRKFYRLFIDGHDCLSVIKSTVFNIAQLEAEGYFELNECFDKVYSDEIVYLSNLANENKACLSLVAFMLLIRYRRPEFLDSDVDKILESQKEAIAIFENSQSENKIDFRLPMAETCFNIAECTLLKYPETFYVKTEQAEDIFACDITVAIDYAYKALTLFSELFAEGKTACQMEIAGIYKFLASLYIKKQESIYLELKRLGLQETAMDPKQDVWTVRKEKRKQIAECEQKIKLFYEDAIKILSDLETDDNEILDKLADIYKKYADYYRLTDTSMGISLCQKAIDIYEKMSENSSEYLSNYAWAYNCLFRLFETEYYTKEQNNQCQSDRLADYISKQEQVLIKIIEIYKKKHLADEDDDDLRFIEEAYEALEKFYKKHPPVPPNL